MSANLPCYLLAGMLVLCAGAHGFLLRAPRQESATTLPIGYAQGYFNSSPRVGQIRVVPFAGNILQSPSSEAQEKMDKEEEVSSVKKPLPIDRF